MPVTLPAFLIFALLVYGKISPYIDANRRRLARRKEKHMSDAQTQIKDTVTANDVVLFMKGTKSMPQWVFLARGRRAELHGNRIL